MVKVPVFRKGIAGDVNNYRPITLTCVPCKIMERVILNQIFDFLMQNNALYHAQHGFIRGRSTCTNLIETFSDWTLTLQYKGSITVAYIDFSKTFDGVSHNKLYIKLESYGIGGSLLMWIKNLIVGGTKPK